MENIEERWYRKKHLFCRYYDTISDFMHDKHYIMCQEWINNNFVNVNDWKCCHHKIITYSYQKIAENKHEHFKNITINDIETMQNQSKLILSTEEI